MLLIMYSLFLKKVFLDAWDNFLPNFVLNLGSFLFAAGGAYIIFLFEPGTAGFFTACAVAVLLLSVYTGGVAEYTGNVVYSGKGDIKGILSAALNGWKQNLAMGLLFFFFLTVLFLVLPFYFYLGGFIAIPAVGIILAMTILIGLPFMYFFPLGYRFNDGLKKQVKKCFLLLFHNTGFTLFLGFHTMVLLAFTLVTAMLIPGISVICMSHQIALKFLLYKYDYLEEHPEADPRRVPWNSLLAEERAKLGTRSLKGFFFPWKD